MLQDPRAEANAKAKADKQKTGRVDCWDVSWVGYRGYVASETEGSGWVQWWIMGGKGGRCWEGVGGLRAFQYYKPLHVSLAMRPVRSQLQVPGLQSRTLRT